MSTKCAPFVTDLFLIKYERDFLMYLSGNKEAEITEPSKSTYLDDLLNI